MSYTTIMEETESEFTLPDKFTSQANKRLLWEIMVENNVFTDISNTYVTNIKADFEKNLQRIKGTITGNDTILELNKKSILKMIEEVKKYRELPNSTTTPHHVPVTSSEVLNKKQAQFQKGLQTKQEEFNQLIQPVKPQTIDFSDKTDDEPIGSEMDMKLSQTIAWREQQLSQVLEKQNPTEANEWINNGKKENVTANGIANVSPIINSSNHIKIGDPTKIDESNFINLKKVSFVEDNVNIIINDRATNDRATNDRATNDRATNDRAFNFMDKLKKKEGIEDIKPDIEILKAELTNVKAELTNVKAELTNVKAELTNVKADLSKLLLDNKLILENHEKILDRLEQIAFQTGSIDS